MGLFDQWNASHYKKHILETGRPATGKVVEIIDNYYQPWEIARMQKKTRQPQKPRKPQFYIVIAYQDALNTAQTLHLLVEDKTPYEPIGREIPLLLVQENGREQAYPKDALLKD